MGVAVGEGAASSSSESDAAPPALAQQSSGRDLDRLEKADTTDGGGGKGGGKGGLELAASEESEPEPQFHRRHGTWKTAVAHVITAVIGAGVLALPSAIAWLGWLGGMLSLLVFAAITLYTSQLLVACYWVNGRRNRTYMEAVESVFGRRGAITLGWIQYTNLFMTAISYNIAGGLTAQEIACLAENEPAGCTVITMWQGILIFAGGQLLLSQTPSMDESWVASVVATAMSFGYSSIALGLSIGKVADGNVHGTLGGRESSDKVWGIFGAFGNVIFAYAFSMILIEIMDTVADAPPGFGDSQFLAAPSASSASTLKDPNAKDGSSLASGGSAAYAGPLPGAAPARDDRQRWQVVQMRKAVNWAMVIITFFFVSVGVFGYLAFGDVPCGTGGNVLTCYSSPRWLLIAANTMVLIHIFPAYQVYSQPVFFFVEGWIRHSPRFPAYASSRAAVISGRCFYVAVVAAISMMLPFFSDMVGLVGALGFWPATVLFPIEMYIRVYKPSRRAWWLLEALNLLCLVLTVCAVAGSVQQIVVDASTYSFFAD